MNTYQFSRNVLAIMRGASKTKPLTNKHEWLHIGYRVHHEGHRRVYTLTYDTALTAGVLAQWNPTKQTLWVTPPIQASGVPLDEVAGPARRALLQMQDCYRRDGHDFTQLKLESFHKKSRVYG